MLSAKLVCILGSLTVSISADLLASVAKISSIAEYRRSPLASHALHRLKRQVIRFNETDLDVRDLPTECVMKCLYSMDEKLDSIFPTNSSINSKHKGQELMEEYDPERFEAFCNVYRPSSDCLKQCPEGEMKTFAISGLKIPETLCVTKFEEFKRNLPCLNKIGKEVEKNCTPQCEQYEHALAKLDKLTETDPSAVEIDLDEMRFLFSQGCKYVKCEEDCGQPMTERACGKEAGDLETLLVSSSFQTINDMMENFKGVSFDFWPPECQKLGKSINLF